MTEKATTTAPTTTTATTTAPAAGLAARAIAAARTYQAVDPEGFHRRHHDHTQWSRWTRRARVARTVATALQVPLEWVTVTDDPARTYHTRQGPVPGDLITVTDPTARRTWRMIPDFTTPGDGWLLLSPCPDPGCAAITPSARIATLADLGDYLDGAHRPVEEAADDPTHSPGCQWDVTTAPSDTTAHATN